MLRPYAEAGWEAMLALWPRMYNFYDTLGSQYFCHFELYVEADWDIEEERPYVHPSKIVLPPRPCNPE